MTENSAEIPYVFKILLLGDGGVGKTSLLLRFIDNTFDPDYKSTIGVQFMTRVVKFDNKHVKLIIWDIAGQSKHATYRHLYYKAANGIILVYDITRSQTFENLPRWLQDARVSIGSDLKIAVLGNKMDLEEIRAVDWEAGKLFTEQNNAEIFSETSAKSGQNVEAAFLALAKALVAKSEKERETSGGGYL
ncbi:MAG: Rab family GTPase [Candidatus Helarchaeota archaeon]